MNTQATTTTLNDGIEIPRLGFGTWQIPNDQVEEVVMNALQIGYRHIDTAAAYGNERGIGQALKHTHIPRKELFITTKLHDMEGYDHTMKQFSESIERLQLDYIDLYLIHWPFDEVVSETWRALETLYTEKRVRAIGVCNFNRERLTTLLNKAKIIPAINQIELHPYFTQKPLRDYCESHKIQIECWSPLMHGKELLTEHTIVALAKKYKKTSAQIILRWHIQHGFIAIPKSTSLERMKQNRDIFNFVLTNADMKQIDLLNQNRRANPIINPDTYVFTKETYDYLQHINDAQ